MSVVIAWAEPPTPEPKKIDLLRDELKERPGEWALIHQSPTSALFFPWWGPLRDDPLFEVKPIKPGATGGPLDLADKTLEVYARYVGRPS